MLIVLIFFPSLSSPSLAPQSPQKIDMINMINISSALATFWKTRIYMINISLV